MFNVENLKDILLPTAEHREHVPKSFSQLSNLIQCPKSLILDKLPESRFILFFFALCCFVFSLVAIWTSTARIAYNNDDC